MLNRLPSLYKALLHGFQRAGPAAAPPAAEPVSVPEPPVHPPASPDQAGAEACPADEILVLPTCPVCGHAERTPACTFNRFALVERPPDERAAAYHYALCHGCGVVYATRRPAGARYKWLFEQFETTLGRKVTDDANPGKLALSSRRLTPAHREHLSRVAAHGVFVSDHLGLKRREYLPALFRDRASNSVHAEIIGSLVPLNAPRVLEVRSRLGTISATLGRLYGAESCVMAIFESQQFLIQEVYGIPAAWPIDFERFQIPFEGHFDLIVANHMLTHVHRPADFLAEVRNHLRPGGWLYLYNETDEGEFLKRGKLMFNNLNPFHFQTFNSASLVRALAVHGFATKFVTLHDGSWVCLAQVQEQPGDWTPMTKHERRRRETAYRQAYDAAVIRMPKHARWQIAEDWDAVVRRAVDSGLATITKRGQVKFRGKRLRS